MFDREIEEWRVGRNFIRKGDLVKVKPSKPKKRDGGLAKVVQIAVSPIGEVKHLQVLKNGTFRYYSPDRIERVAQKRHGEKREVRA